MATIPGTHTADQIEDGTAAMLEAIRVESTERER